MTYDTFRSCFFCSACILDSAERVELHLYNPEDLEPVCFKCAAEWLRTCTRCKKIQHWADFTGLNRFEGFCRHCIEEIVKAEKEQPALEKKR